MRIIAGELKGRRLAAPTWPGVRPTSDKLRETLFNILAPLVERAEVIDGYAGTGALGIEALSRGAARVTFIESDPRAVRLIAENLLHCGVDPESDARCRILQGSFAATARALPAESIDLVLLDPPYNEADLEGMLAAAGHVLSASGTVVLEHARRRQTPEAAAPLHRTRIVLSGDSALAFYARAPAAE